jgi:endogenous inhibitor of DNA gyrase (YacG/DUF329 family)
MPPKVGKRGEGKCIVCGKKFDIIWIGPKKKYCSKRCANRRLNKIYYTKFRGKYW